jgi:hypothetical protein
LEIVLWTFRRNENDVVNLYNTLSPVMELATEGSMLNFGYWHKKDTSPIDAQNRLCNEVGKSAELGSANSLLDIGSGLSSPAITWATQYPHIDISCVNINYIQLQLAKKIVKERILSSVIHEVNSTSTQLPFSTPTKSEAVIKTLNKKRETFNNFILEDSYSFFQEMSFVVTNKETLQKNIKFDPRNVQQLLKKGIKKAILVNKRTSKKFKLIEKIEIGSDVFEPLANYYIKNRKRLKNKILTKYPAYVENVLFKSLLKMKRASHEKLIDYLLIKCIKAD